ncbi:hypothetical protein GOP47_0029636 [Adiantum capillus-veneris]|nr:hypothetical protein GOP47_0029636 [Adiantum capillus-veneris]
MENKHHLSGCMATQIRKVKRWARGSHGQEDVRLHSAVSIRTAGGSGGRQKGRGVLRATRGNGSAARLVWRRRWGWPPGLEKGSRQAEYHAYYCRKLSVEGCHLLGGVESHQGPLA